MKKKVTQELSKRTHIVYHSGWIKQCCQPLEKKKKKGNKNAKALKLHSAILLCPFSYDYYFLRSKQQTIDIFVISGSKSINKNLCFVFNSTLFEFLTFFSTAILTGS